MQTCQVSWVIGLVAVVVIHFNTQHMNYHGTRFGTSFFI